MTDQTAPDAFLSALTSRDFVRFAASLAPSAQARFLLPRGPEVRSGRDEIARRFEGWFAAASEFEVVAATVTPIARRYRLTWRLRMRRDSGPREVIEQVAYVDTAPDGIATIDMMCSGFLRDEAPVASPEVAVGAGTIAIA
ncbi:MAG: nuclear transport factor 2 family protein [Candidatus Dormiibacterota bacterium]